VTTLDHLRWVLRHPGNERRRVRAGAKWLFHNARRRTSTRRDLSVPFLATRLTGPMDPTTNPFATLAYYTGGPYDFDAMMTLRLILEPADCFIDVGANIGSYALLAACCVGGDGLVVAVEPGPGNVPYLRRNLDAATAPYLIRERFLADRERDLPVRPQGSSKTRLEQRERPEAATEAERWTRTSTLDNELDGISADWSQSFAKIDVEGWEPAVLRGGERWLASRPLGMLLEANGLQHRSPVSWRELVELVQGHGFTFCWPAYKARTIQLFQDPSPSPKFENYFALGSPVLERLQRDHRFDLDRAVRAPDSGKRRRRAG
jgi:FkbM family methyltransferase